MHTWEQFRGWPNRKRLFSRQKYFFHRGHSRFSGDYESAPLSAPESMRWNIKKSQRVCARFRATVEDVLSFFSQVRQRPRNPNVERDQIDPLLRRLGNVNGAASDAIEFLGALNDDFFDKAIPVRVPSGLHSGGRIE